jgi:hypothetical protein
MTVIREVYGTLKFIVVDSPWQNSLPIGADAKNKVVVFFYSEFWIPVSSFCLSEAITLHQKAFFKGKEIVVFPTGLDLEHKNIFLSESWGDKLNLELTQLKESSRY